MVGDQSTVNSLAYLRGIDYAEQLTRFDSSPVITPLVQQGSVSLLNATDVGDLSPKVMFLARALFITSLRVLGDAATQEQKVNSILKTSLEAGYETLNPEEAPGSFPAAIFNSDVQNYYESEEHAQLKTFMVEAAGNPLHLASPHDFLDVARSSLGSGNYLFTTSTVINFALSCPQSCDYSAEEIFVACSLVTCEKSPVVLPQFEAWLNEFFEASREKGDELKLKVLAALEEYSDDPNE